MLRLRGFLLVAFVGQFVHTPTVLGCTTVAFAKSAECLVAKSYDWHQAHGAVVINPKGLHKTALRFWPADRPQTWIADHASATFVQHGREFPLGGMNDAGLVVEVMWLDENRPTPLDKRRTVNELQWIQYQLDRFSTVEEVLRNADPANPDSVRISRIYARVHYLACDATGACAAFEDIAGPSGKGQTVRTVAAPGVLTNETYAAMSARLGQYVGFGGQSAIPGDQSSLSRFVRAAAWAHALDPAKIADPVGYAFQALQSVGGTTYSKFHIVYEPKLGRVHFRTLGYRALKTFKLGDFETQCSASEERSRMIDVNQTVGGEVGSKFGVYSEAANRGLVAEALKDRPAIFPSGAIDVLATHPRTSVCK